MAYGRWCPKRVRGTGQAGQTSLAGWTRQGRSRGSICVYRATRVWDRRSCSDTSAIIALRLAPIRPPRRPVSRPASQYRRPGHARQMARHRSVQKAFRGSFERMKHMETAPGGQDAPGGARYDPLKADLKAGTVACRPSARPSTCRRRGGEASAASDARGQPRGQPGTCAARPGTANHTPGRARHTTGNPVGGVGVRIRLVALPVAIPR